MRGKAESINYIERAPKSADVVIIGAGIIGLFIAWELSKYNLKILVVDNNPEVGFGVSKGQTGIIHVVQTPLNTIKSKLCLKGNKLYKAITSQLNVKISWHKLYMVALSLSECLYIPLIYLYLKSRGYPVKIVRGKRVRERDPIVSKRVKLAIEIDGYGAIDTFDMIYALAENASKNGVMLLMNCKVNSIKVEDDKVIGVDTNKGFINSKIVINAAGLYAEDLANKSLGHKHYKYILAKGVNIIFDDPNHHKNFYVRVPIKKDPRTKGGGALLTWDGKQIWGPNFIVVSEKDETQTSPQDYNNIVSKFSGIFRDSPREPIKIYAGIRPINSDRDDFKIDSPISGLINLVGIDSPGFTAAPEIAKIVVNMIRDMNFKFTIKSTYISTREKLKRISEISLQELEKLINKDPDWGIVICIDPPVSLGMVKEAINRGARTLDGVCFRTGLWMGREQDMPYLPDIIYYMSRVLDIDPKKLTKHGRKSTLIYGE